MIRSWSFPIILAQFLLGGQLLAYHSVECFTWSHHNIRTIGLAPSTERSRRVTPTNTRRDGDTRLNAVAKTGGKVLQTSEEFTNSVLKKTDGPILVFFTAPWCGPCRLSVPVVKEIKKEFTGKITVVEVCTDDLPDVASDAGVVSIPTIQMYNDGRVMDTIVGCVAESVLSSSVSKVLEDIEQQNQ